MKRELLIAVGATTIVAAAAACSSGNNAAGPSSTAASSSGAGSSSVPASPTTPAAAGETKVIVGGQQQNVSGPVVCSTTDGKFSIAIGEVITGVIIGLEQDGSVVHNAGLGIIDGVPLSFTEGVPGQSATATKSGNVYKITGTAGGADNAGQPVTKPFEVDVTCP